MTEVLIIVATYVGLCLGAAALGYLTACWVGRGKESAQKENDDHS